MATPTTNTARFQRGAGAGDEGPPRKKRKTGGKKQQLEIVGKGRVS